MAIKVYRSTDLGAPSLTGKAGSQVALFDAVLVNGYGSVTVSSITQSSNTATCTTSSAHGLSTGDSATIAGCTQTDYNGDFVVTVTSGTTFTYSIANNPASPATGSPTFKRSPGGFSKPFSATNIGTYKSLDVSSVQHYLRIDDTGGSTGGFTETRVRAYETMTDANTGTGPYPTTAQNADGYYWRKSSTADSVARPWLIITNGKTVYYFNEYAGTAANGIVGGGNIQFSGLFGDVNSYKAGDAYASILTGTTTANSTSSPPNGLFLQQTSITAPTTFNSSAVFARDFTGLGGAKYVGFYASGMSNAMGVTAYIAYPHAVDNGFYIVPVLLTQTTIAAIRGSLPGAYECLHGRALNHGDTITNVQGITGRTFLTMYGQSSNSQGCLMIDVTGPW